MIALLEGKLAEKTRQSLVLNVHGVGYEVFINPATLEYLPETGADLSLHIYTHITESSQQLYGFRQKKEKQLFIRLISINGIGPKLGLQILSGMDFAGIITAITTEDTSRLTTISGVGKKTAERLCVELKDKLSDLVDAQFLSTPSHKTKVLKFDGAYHEALLALEHLGYQRQEAQRALDQIEINPNTAVENVLKESLSLLSRI